MPVKVLLGPPYRKCLKLNYENTTLWITHVKLMLHYKVSDTYRFRLENIEFEVYSMATVNWHTANTFCNGKNMSLAESNTNLKGRLSFVRTQFYWLKKVSENDDNCAAMMDQSQTREQTTCGIQCDVKSAFVCQKYIKGKKINSFISLKPTKLSKLS